MIGSDDGLDSTELLAQCRGEISDIDAHIVETFAKRVALAKRTTALKVEIGLPILDPKREAEVIRRNVARAREAGLPEETIRSIFWQILGMSRDAQETE